MHPIWPALSASCGLAWFGVQKRNMTTVKNSIDMAAGGSRQATTIWGYRMKWAQKKRGCLENDRTFACGADNVGGGVLGLLQLEDTVLWHGLQVTKKQIHYIRKNVSIYNQKLQHTDQEQSLARFPPSGPDMAMAPTSETTTVSRFSERSSFTAAMVRCSLCSLFLFFPGCLLPVLPS